jgi:ribosomal-protein-serine acetyltransferase
MFTCKIDSSLELRLLEEHHADEVFSVVDSNREHLRRWLPWVNASKSADDTRAFIRRALEQFARHDGFQAGIWLDDHVVGCLGLHFIKWHNRRTEIGYWLAEPAQGRGIMTRSCRALIDHAFGELSLNRVEIHCAVGNNRSRGVPERLGFHAEGTHRQIHAIDGQYHDDIVYAMLAEDWKSMSA